MKGVKNVKIIRGKSEKLTREREQGESRSKRRSRGSSGYLVHKLQVQQGIMTSIMIVFGICKVKEGDD